MFTTTKLPESVKTLWLEALRSGKYVQGRGVMRSVDDKFCCLGVLCHLYASTEWELNSNEDDYYTMDGVGSVLPFEIQGRLNIDGMVPVIAIDDMSEPDRAFCANLMGYTVKDLDGEMPLASLNDRGATFEQIAYFIEKYM